VVEVLSFVQHVGGRINAGEGPKVMNEVRLIEVAAGEREIDPINLACDVDQLEDSLETAHAAERLGSEADCLAEAVDEGSLTEADFLSHH